MNKKIIMFTLMLVLLTSFVIADNYGTFKAGDDVVLLQLCSSCTFNNITSVTSPNSQSLVTGVEMVRSGSQYSYTLTGNYTGTYGVYRVNGVGDLAGDDTVWAYEFTVNSNGLIQSQTQGLAVAIFILVVTLGLFILPMYKDFSKNEFANLVLKRSCWILSIYLMVLNSSIMATIAQSSGLDVTNEMFQYMWLFGTAGWLLMAFVFFSTFLKALGMWKIARHNRRFGEDD